MECASAIITACLRDMSVVLMSHFTGAADVDELQNFNELVYDNVLQYRQNPCHWCYSVVPLQQWQCIQAAWVSFGWVVDDGVGQQPCQTVRLLHNIEIRVLH